MLDRLRRKLFLSVKIMGSLNDTADPTSDPEGSNSSVSELMDILRRGSSSLVAGGAGGMSLKHFLTAGVEEILNASREKDDMRVEKMKNDLGASVADTAPGESKSSGLKQSDTTVQRKWEEEEQALLVGVAQVQSRLFEGKLVQRATSQNESPAKGPLRGLGLHVANNSSASLSVSKTGKENKAMADAWTEVQRRAKRGEESGVVMVNGLEVDMAFVGDLQSDAQPKSATGKKPKRKPYEHEDWCIHCRDGGDLVCCSYCPRGTLVQFVCFIS